MPYTPVLDVLTDAVAGSGNVRRSQQRASARLYAGLDRKMKAVRDISPEVMSGSSNASSQKSTSDAAEWSPSQLSSRRPSHEQQPFPHLPSISSRIELQRSQSELPMKSSYINGQPVTPAKTSTAETSGEQMKKNYSHSDLHTWKHLIDSFPPMPTMTGFSRYRVAATADPQWRSEYFRKQVSGLDSMVAGLDMTDMGVTTGEWQSATDSGVPRRDSGLSSQSHSTRTTASCETPEPFIDPITGTRITRGFSPSPASSTRSSFKDGQPYSRRGSNLSIVASFHADPDMSHKRIPQIQCPALSLERRTSNPLSTISELHSQVPELTTRKLEKPCDFADGGNLESAVASDAEDDEEVWTDVVEEQTEKTSAISQMIKHGQISEGQTELRKTRTNSSERRRGRGSMTSLNRTNTIRTLRPQAQRRRSSRSTSTATVTGQEKARPSERKDKSQVQFSIPVPQIDGSDHISEAMEGCTLGANQKICTILQQNPDPFQSEVATLEQGAKYAPRVQRNRSATTLLHRQNLLKK